MTTPPDRSSRIRVAFLIDRIQADTGGTEGQLLEIVRRIDRRRFEPFLVCLSDTEWLAGNRVPCQKFTLGYEGFLRPSFPRVLRRLAGFLREQSIDIVQTFFRDSIFVAALGTKLADVRPALISSRRDIGLGSEPWYHALYGAVLPAVDRMFDGIVANCEAVRRFVVEREQVSPAFVQVISNGVSIPERRATIPALFREHPADVWIVTVANLRPVKRIDLLVDAIALVRDARPGLALGVVVLGAGSEEASLRERRDRLGLAGRVHFLGSVTQVEDHVMSSDVGVLCSSREGLSNAVLEYMACGLPVVATDVGGNVELVDERNGVIVPPGDARALARAIGRLAADGRLRAELGAESKRKVERHFSWEKSISATEAYLASILERKRTRR